MKLTDDDDKALASLLPIGSGSVTMKEIYIAGLRAGLEHAAKICNDKSSPPHTLASENADHYRGFQDGAIACEKAIRAVAKE